MISTFIKPPTLFRKELPNGLRYPLVGGMRQRHFAGTNLEPRKTLKNSQTPTTMAPTFFVGDRVHAVLGGFLERQTPSLKIRTTANLTRLLHEPLTLTIDKNHNQPKRDILKDS